VLVKRHGQDAPIHAAMRADALLDKGDLDGYDLYTTRVGDTQHSRPQPTPGPLTRLAV
jgi:hypothetical protein